MFSMGLKNLVSVEATLSGDVVPTVRKKAF